MSFYPHVNRGEVFKPNALLENDVRDLINKLKASGMPKRIGCAASAFYVQVWNVEDGKLPAGAAVSILVDSDLPVVDGALPCRSFTGDYRIFGVLKTELAPGDIGDCVVDGMVEVPITGSAYPGARALPVISDGKESQMPKFGVAPAGGARVLGITDDGNAVLDLGGDDDYFGLFKVALSYMSGYEGEYSEESHHHGSSETESSSEEELESSESSFDGSSEDSSENSFDSPGLDDSSSGGGSGGGGGSGSGSGGGSSNGGSSNGGSSGGSESSIDSIWESGVDSDPFGGGSSEEESSVPGTWAITGGSANYSYHIDFVAGDYDEWSCSASYRNGTWEWDTDNYYMTPGVSATVSKTGVVTLTVGVGDQTYTATGRGSASISEGGGPDENEYGDIESWHLSASVTATFTPAASSSRSSGSGSGGGSDSRSSSGNGNSSGDDGSGGGGGGGGSGGGGGGGGGNSGGNSGGGSGDGFSDEPYDGSSDSSFDGSSESVESSESFSDESSESSSEENGSSGNSSGSHGHHGGFVDNGELVLAVYDGADPDAEDCGFADCGGTRIYYPRTVFTNWRRKRDLYVYVSDDQIILSEEYPDPDPDVLSRLLARLIYCNGVYAVVQEHHGPIYEFVCDCSESGDGSGSGSSGSHGGGSGSESGGGSGSESGGGGSGSKSGGGGSSGDGGSSSSSGWPYSSSSGGSHSASRSGSRSGSRSKSRSGSRSSSESSSGYEESGFSWIQGSSKSGSMGSKSGSSSTSWFSSGLIVGPSGENPSSRMPGMWKISSGSITYTDTEVTGKDRHTWEGGFNGSVTLTLVNGEWQASYNGDHPYTPDFQVSVNERGYITLAIAVDGHTFRRSGYGSVHLSESWEDGAPDPGEYASGTPDYEIYEGVQWQKRSLSVTISAAREGDLSAGGDE